MSYQIIDNFLLKKDIKELEKYIYDIDLPWRRRSCTTPQKQ